MSPPTGGRGGWFYVRGCHNVFMSRVISDGRFYARGYLLIVEGRFVGEERVPSLLFV